MTIDPLLAVGESGHIYCSTHNRIGDGKTENDDVVSLFEILSKFCSPGLGALLSRPY